jgi:hypothetical protein
MLKVSNSFNSEDGQSMFLRNSLIPASSGLKEFQRLPGRQCYKPEDGFSMFIRKADVILQTTELVRLKSIT